MATVKIYRRLVAKNPFGVIEEGTFELPDEEEILSVTDFNSYNFSVLSWVPPPCDCPHCDGSLLDFEEGR